MKKIKKTGLSFLIFLLLVSCESPLRQAVIDELKLPAPTISPAGGRYKSGIPLTIAQTEPGAEIYYIVKKDGIVIQEGVYKGEVLIGQHMKKFQVEAYTRKDLALDSEISVEAYNFVYGSLESPLITPAETSQNSDLWVSIDNTLNSTGCDIYYDIPKHPDFVADSSPRLYTGPILLTGDDKNYTVNAYAVTEGKPPSAPVSKEYTISYDPVAPPTIDPQPGSYGNGQVVTFSQEQGAKISYQRVFTDSSGTTTGNWSTYTAPITVNRPNSSTVFNLKIEKAGFKTLTTSATYTIDSDYSPTPSCEITHVDNAGGLLSASDIEDYVVNVENGSGVVHRSFSITLDAPGLTEGGKIFYNLAVDDDAPLPIVMRDDEDNPSAAEMVGTVEYTGPIPIGIENSGKTIRIKAISAAPDMTNSTPIDIEIDFTYLTAAKPVILTDELSGPRNTDWVWTASLDPSANPAQRLGTNLEYQVLGGGLNLTEFIGLGESSTIEATTGINDIFQLTLNNSCTDPQLIPSSTKGSVFIDTTAPAAPEILPSSDFFNSLYINSNNTSPRINWRGESADSSNYRVYVDDILISTSTYIYDDLNDEHYINMSSTLGDGNHDISVIQWDEVGNPSPYGNLTVTKDTVRPIISFHSPVNKGVNLSPHAAVHLTFSEDILEDDVLDVSNYSYSPALGTPPTVVRPTSKQVSITPENPLNNQSKILVTVNKSIRDLAGNEMAEKIDFYYFTAPSVTYSYMVGTVAQRFTRVPASTFPTGFDDLSMGSIASFDMGQTEVTYALWDDMYQWAVANGYTFMNSGTNNGAQKPVSEISFADIIVWCNAASDRMGLGFVYWNDGGGIINNANLVFTGGVNQDISQDGIRLPTVDEWECAARFIDGTEWLPGSHASGAYDMIAGKNDETYAVAWTANTPAGGGILQAVGLLRGNPLLCYDMSGNIGEFVFDPDDINAAYKGSYYDSVANTSHAVGGTPNFSTTHPSESLGFRVAKNLP